MLVYAYWLPCSRHCIREFFSRSKKLCNSIVWWFHRTTTKTLEYGAFVQLFFLNCCDCNRRHIVIPSHLLIHEIQTNIRRCAIEFVHLTMGNASEREKCNWNWKCMQKMPFLCNKPLFLYASLSCWLFE